MTNVRVESAALELSDAIKRVASGEERVMVHTETGEVAAIVTLADLDLIERLEDFLDNDLADRAREDPGEDVPWAAIKKELNL